MLAHRAILQGMSAETGGRAADAALIAVFLAIGVIALSVLEGGARYLVGGASIVGLLVYVGFVARRSGGTTQIHRGSA